MAKNDLATPQASDLALDQDYAAQLLGGLMESRTTVLNTGGSGKPLLRMVEGKWIFGQSDDAVQKGSHWAINVRSLGWGHVCWTAFKGQKNKRLGLVVGPLTKEQPPRPDPIEGFAFQDYVTFDALCLDGDDEGLEVTYGTNSMGGLRAFSKLRDAIIAQLQKDISHPCPVVTLSSEGYKGNYGQNYNPIFTITGWADLGGNLAATGAGQAKPVRAEPAPAAPAARVKAPLQEPEDVQEAPVSTQQAHVGQRRRHRPTA
jgi:hypothetical protein